MVAKRVNWKAINTHGPSLPSRRGAPSGEGPRPGRRRLHRETSPSVACRPAATVRVGLGPSVSASAQSRGTERPDLAIHEFTRLIARGEPIPQYGDGSSRRDYTYVDDVLPEQPGDVGQTYADVSRARRLLGYDLSVSIEEGIGRFVAWSREHEERLT